MRKNHRANRAILVLECPWGLDDSDANRSSVIPFVEGIGKYAGDTEVYHANFYDKSSFIKALDHLCKSSFDNTIVYIAAHGLNNKIAGIKISDLMHKVGERSKAQNITGLILGSCFAGKDEFTLQTYIEDTNIKWCTGYTSSCAWLNSTFIDCSILAQMLGLGKKGLSDWNTIIGSIANAIAPFAANMHLGEDVKDLPVSLRQSLQVVAQPSGQGNRAKTITQEVWEATKAYQI